MKVESLIEKTEKRAKKMKEAQAEKEYALLLKCKARLDTGASLQSAELNEEEQILVRNFDFLTRKPVFVLVNVGEDRITAETGYDFGGFPSGQLSLKIEEEIFGLPEAEQKEFLDSLGLKEPGLSRIIHACYSMTNLISFFTTGEDEVKAWTIRQGTNARAAAGAIHSDIERGFIRAEVTHYDDFIRAGSDQEAKKLNLLKLEGKEYVVLDGDIVHFRFNV
jgi:ribosome-binding ATPase YchF (GTP1/OBG family)